MKLSIIIPSYNQASFLGAAIESCLEQSGDNEIIVMDGGSSDGSKEVIQSYSKHLAFWRSHRDEGQSAAINEGVEYATGEYFTWLNSDDVLCKGATEHVRSCIQNGAPDVVYGNHGVIDSLGNRIQLHYHPPYQRVLWLKAGPYIAQPGTFIKTKTFKSLGSVDKSLHCVMDTDLWYRMALARCSFKKINQCLALFRVHPGSKGGSWHSRYEKEYQILGKRYGYRSRSLASLAARIAYLFWKCGNRLLAR